MKPTTTIFACVLAAGMASAQSPSIIQNTRDTMNGVSANATAASNMALQVGDQAPSAADATKAAVTPNSASPTTPGTTGTKTTGTKTSSAKSSHKARKQGAIVATTAGTANSSDAKSGDSKSGEPSSAIVAGTEAAGSEGAGSDDPGAADKKYNPNGKRDPFLSPVVSHAGGSSCSTGKKCLEIGTISLRGIVHAESGFIAVVSNGLNKAYFLHENDPVFNGYVVKITGDSIVFQETLQDRLGKTFTREVRNAAASSSTPMS
jgi:hypothetical protein